MILVASAVLFACEKNQNDPELVIKIAFDDSKPRLDNFGNPTDIPAGHAAQSPSFNSMSAHYIEFAPNGLTALGSGEIIYKGLETTEGGANAVDFNQAKIVQNNEVLYRTPLSEVTPGTYEWVRASLTYQNYDITFKNGSVDYEGTLASFVGFNTYIQDHVVGIVSETVNANKLQGYWAFEALGIISNGQAPGTTVPNPLSDTSPVPPGSCVVTGEFKTPLVITGNETEDIVVTLTLSTNQSFEWEDDFADGKFEPAAGETVVDMGLRGLYPSYE